MTMDDRIEIDGLHVTVETLDNLTVPQLREVLKRLVGSAPKGARKPELLSWARTALAIHAGAEPMALPPPPDDPHDATIERFSEVVGDTVIPSIAKWSQMVEMGRFLAQSNLTPVALRGKPADVTMVLLGAHDLGIPMTQALGKLIVIDGKLTMSAELMVALVLRDGHSLVPDKDNDAHRAIAHWRRGDNGDSGTVTYTIDDALDAGLVALRDGKPYARSREGKPLPWERYTADLLWARCVSRTCRRVFPDCLAGVSYTPEELGYIDSSEEGPRVRGLAGETEPTMTIKQQRDDIARRIEDLPGDLRTTLAYEWRQRRLPRTAELTPGGIRQALRLLEDAEQGVADREKAGSENVEAALMVCPYEGCETLTPDGRYCVEHNDADSPEAREWNGPGGAPERAQEPPEAAPAPETAQEPSESDSGADPDGVECVGCHELISSFETPVSTEHGPMHADCAPFTGEG